MNSSSIDKNNSLLEQDEQIPFRNWLAVIGSSIGAFMAVLDIQITSSSLRDIQGALAASVDEGSWISTSYLIAEIITIPLTGWLSKVFSPKLYICANAILFVFFSMLCGLAQNLETMILCRFAQGFTGGTLIPMSFSSILSMLPKSKQPVGLAIFGITATFAPSIGPAVGGFLTDLLSWQYIFYINLIPGLLLIALLFYALPASKMQLDLLKKHDLPGILFMAVGLSCLTFTLEEGQRKDWFGSELIQSTATLAALFLIAFVIRELLAKHPLVNLRLLKRRNFGLGSIANVAMGMALYGSVFLLPFYLGIAQDYSSWQIGQVMIWSGLPQLFIMPFLPYIMRKIDLRLLMAFGLLMFAASCLINGFMSHDYAGEQLRAALLIRALGQPFIMVPLSTMTTAGIEAGEAGSASALFNMMRNLGGSVGTALASTLIVQREQFHSFRISEQISSSDLALREWLTEAAATLKHGGGSLWAAKQQALELLAANVRKEAYVMAFNDAFTALFLVLIIAVFAVAFLKRESRIQAIAE